MEKIKDTILEAIDDKKGIDVTEIRLEDNSIADYFIIATGRSNTQTKAIADEVEHKLYDLNIEVIGKEGYRDGEWILLDYGNIIVHIFLAEQREYYNLEKLWARVD